MRKISITHIEAPEPGGSIFKDRSCYTIILGNGATVRFTNSEKADAFIVKTNIDLNYILITLNQILIETYSHYRKIWFYIPNHADHIRIENACDSEFKCIDHALKMATTRDHYSTGNTTVFKNLFNLIESLGTIISQMQRVEKNSKHYIEVRMLEVFKDRLGFAKANLSHIGKEDSTLILMNDQMKINRLENAAL